MAPVLNTVIRYIFVLCLVWSTSRAQNIVSRSDSLKVLRLLTLSANEKERPAALTYALNSLSIALRLNNNILIAKSYRQLSDLYRRERMPRLYELDSMCVQYAAKTMDSDLYFDALQLITKDYLNNNQTGKAEIYLPLLDSVEITQATPYYQCVANHIKGFYYFKKFKPAAALEFSKKSLYYAGLYNKPLLTARALYQVGFSFQYLFKHDSAAVYLFKAMDELKKLDDPYEQANVNSALAFLYQTTGNLPKSLSYYELCYDEYRKAGFPLDAAYIKLAATDVLFTQNETDSAYQSIVSAINTFRNCGYTQGLGLSYNYLGRYYGKAGNKDSARYYYTLAKESLKPINNPLLNLYTNSYEAIDAMRLGNSHYGDSLVKVQLGKVSKTINSNELLAGAVNMLAIPGVDDSVRNIMHKEFLTGRAKYLDADTGNINPFTGALPQFDSLISLRQNEAVSKIEAQYKVKEAHDSVLLAGKENQLVKQKLAFRNQTLLFFTLLLLIVLFLLYLQFRHRKTIELLKEDADHRVTNMLTNISSIIDRVRTSSADRKAFDVLEEKVAPLNLLYQLLSQRRKEEILLQEYFEKICHGLKATYDHDNIISIHIDAAVSMPGKKAGRAGLIVNELVTNSFKHAFNDLCAGSITVICKKEPGNKYYLAVADTGAGIAQAKSSQRGLQQVKALAWELSATVKEKKEQGVCFEFYFF